MCYCKTEINASYSEQNKKNGWLCENRVVKKYVKKN